VTSPTFTLIHEYPGRLTLFHIDAYRLRGPAELLALGFDELSRADSVVVMEWADRVREAMPADALWITLTVAGDTQRNVSMSATGKTSLQCLEAFKNVCN
jgi:tRNA threonylcarbamoyladenosine biosynthesis protein TsaE